MYVNKMVTRPVYKRQKKINKHVNLTKSLKRYTLPLTKMSYTNSPPKYKITLKPKPLPLFVTNDKR